MQQVGFLCLETGMVRSKNNINVAVKNLSDLTLVLVCYGLLGHWILTGHFLNFEHFPATQEPYNTLPSFFIYALYCATTMTIVSGPVAERMPIRPYLLLGVMVSSLLSPLLVKWIWTSDGWLNQLGVLDFAGGTLIHASAGSIALACIIIVGPRKGRFDSETFKGSSNLGLSILGCLFLWLGWLGFNAGSFNNYHELTAHVIWITLLSGALGGGLYLAWTLVTGHAIIVERFINCILAALVSITAAPHLINSMQALLFSLAGIASYLAISKALEKMKLDDAIDAIGVHLGAGITGSLMLPLFFTQSSFSSQLLMITVVCVLSFITSYVTLIIMKKLGVAIRISPKEEETGLNVVEHNASSDLYELIKLMSYHQKTGDLSSGISTDPNTEAGLIAEHYGQTVKTIEKTQKALEEQTRKAKQANEAKSEFLANMSHEIRTPMNGVLGMAQVLETTQLDTDQKSMVSTIRNSGQLLMSIINDILDFSKIENGKLQLNLVTCNLLALLTSTLQCHQATAQEKGLNIQLEAEGLKHQWVKIDDVRLTQILGNIIGNAIKFTEIGSITLRCRSNEINKNKITIYFEIQDTGIGIKQENLLKIFSEFEQEDTSTTRQFGGTGLGLTLSQNLAELMGSEIHVKSEVGKGSVFYFDLTCETGKKDKHHQDKSIQKNIPPTIKAEDTSSSIKLLNNAILVVEDNDINYMVLESPLLDICENVHHAKDGEEAIKLHQKQAYDIIFMDCMLPGIDGVTATRHIRQHEKGQALPRTPIVALTADVTKENQRNCADAGMDDFISKPFPIHKIQEVMKKWALQK